MPARAHVHGRRSLFGWQGNPNLEGYGPPIGYDEQTPECEQKYDKWQKGCMEKSLSEDSLMSDMRRNALKGSLNGER